MRFAFEQRTQAGRSVVEAAFGDPAFYLALGEMPNLGVEGVLDHQPTAVGTKLAVRFRFNGSVSSAVRAVVDPAKLTWVTNSVVMPAEHRIRFNVVPDFYPDRLECHGSYTFDDRDPNTLIKLEGDLIVRGIPFVGRTVEKTILSGFKEHVAGEAELLERWPH